MTYCSVVTVLALDGLAKKRFGHHAIMKILSLRSPSSDTDFISIVKAKLLLFLLAEMAYFTWVTAAIVAGHFFPGKVFHGEL